MPGARRLALALSILANHYWGAAEFRRAIEYGQRALQAAARAPKAQGTTSAARNGRRKVASDLLG